MLEKESDPKSNTKVAIKEAVKTLSGGYNAIKNYGVVTAEAKVKETREAAVAAVPETAEATTSPMSQRKQQPQQQPTWTQVVSRKEKKEAKRDARIPQPPKPRPISLTVRQEGKSYADLARELKGCVNPADQGVTVQFLHSTTDGGVRIVMNPGEGAAEGVRKIAAAIGEKMEDAKKAIAGVKMRVVILGIDDVTELDEVKGAAEKVVGHELMGQVSITLRKTRRGDQIATIVTARSIADTLLQGGGKIRIGWLNCTIREDNRPMRCFKCWKDGHQASRCNGPDLSRKCFNCGSDEHKVSECANAAKCLKCEGGHRTGARECKGKKPSGVI